MMRASMPAASAATSEREMRSSAKPGSVATTMNNCVRLAASSFDLYWSERYSSVLRSVMTSITPWFCDVSVSLTMSPTATLVFLPRVTHCSLTPSASAR